MVICNIIKEGNRIHHYDVLDDNNKIVKMTKEQVINSIKCKAITNAKIQIYNGNTIVRVNKNVKTQLLNKNTNNKNIFNGAEAIERLIRTESGTPLKITVKQGLRTEDVIFVGIRDIQSRESFVFFNGEGLNGLFGLTSNAIREYNTKIEFNNCDTVRITELLNLMKQAKF